MKLHQCPHMAARCPHKTDACDKPESIHCLFVKNSVRTATGIMAVLRNLALKQIPAAESKIIDGEIKALRKFLTETGHLQSLVLRGNRRIRNPVNGKVMVVSTRKASKFRVSKVRRGI